MKKSSLMSVGTGLKGLLRSSVLGLLVLAGVAPLQSALALSTVNMATVPLIALKSAPGLVMLTMSRDQRLFYAAYNDVTDLDGDGTLDVGYKESFTYYGYFESNRCYKYQTTGTTRFIPVSVEDNISHCGSSTGRWHGNWLNWMTTSRMDALRKVLYGGYRQTDTATSTILEAAHIPPDLHIWGKEYRPTASGGTDAYDITKYTPLATPGAGKQHIFLMKSEGTSTAPYIGSAPPSLRIAANVDAVIDRIWLWASSERPVGGAAGTTVYTRPAGYTSNLTSALYNAKLPGFDSGTSYSGTTKAYSFLDYFIRVETCVDLGGVVESNCKGYPSSAPTKYKPTGVLHDYASVTIVDATHKVVKDSLKFGLLTGSYTNNYSGGVLRKDIASFTDEYDASTGIFTNVNGIVKTINNIKTYGFDISSQTYVSNNVDASCPPGVFMWNRLRCQGEVNMWGAPVAEMMYEGLRYFTDKQPLSAFATGVSATTSADTALGLPLVSTWSNPFRAVATAADGSPTGGSPICSRPMEMVIADPITSFDSDQLPGAAFAPGTGRGATIPASDIGGLNVGSQADQIWASEFGASATKNFFIGQSAASNADGNPSAKAANSFKYLRGHSPDETNTEGSYYAGSVAKFGHETGVPVRPNSATATTLTKVDNISVALGSVIPKMQITYLGKTVTLVPFSKSVAGCSPAPSAAVASPSGFQPTGLITGVFIDRIANTTASNVDASINSGRPFSRFMVSFSDMDVGGDNEADTNVYYTMYVDATGKLVIQLNPYYQATCSEMHMGYVLSGTTKDGVYLEVRGPNSSGVKYYLDTGWGATPADPYTSGSRTPSALLSNSVSSRSFTFSSSASTATYVPHDPLWYAAKYGGAGILNQGNPTNYFQVTNASLLPGQMSKAFRSAAALAAVASTSVVGVGQRSLGSAAIYQANYDSLTWTSRLYAFPISTAGVLSDTPVWEASSLIPATVASRTKLFLGRGGSTTPLALASTAYASLTTAEKTDFGDADRYAYLLGDKSKEERNLADGGYRNRGVTVKTDTSTAALAVSTYGSVLGDIVNSDPQIINKRDYDYTASDATYTAFLTGLTGEVIAVGSNDGFFHVFDATPSTGGGAEVLAFMPQAARAGIKDLADPAYQHRNFVDGSIGVGHAKFKIPAGSGTSDWRSVAVTAGGSGAKTVFAVNIPANTATTPFAASDILWEINQTAATAAGYGTTFGNVMGRPAIGKLVSGKWVTIFGNGYNSYDTTANLYVVELETGNILKVIPTDGSTGNGMGAIEIVRKTSGNRDTIDYVYGSDYKGNIWRFDLSSASMSSWSSSGALVYRTPAGRHITAEIKTGLSPAVTARTTGGRMVYFGTGSYLSAADPTDTTTVNALYGIFDDLLNTSSTVPSVVDGDLASFGITAASGADVRTVAAAASPYWYAQAGTQKGWIVPLTGTNIVAGERVIAPPVRYTVPGLVDAFLFTSIVPSTDDCVAGLDAWITGIDAMTGGYAKVFSEITDDSVRIRGGSPRGVFVLNDGGAPTLYISQTIFDNTVPTTSFGTGAGGSQTVCINGTCGQTRIISITLTPPPVTPTSTSVKKSPTQVWRQLK